MSNTPILDQLKSELCEHGRIASIACWECCITCNYDDHRCHFCGDALRHDGTLYKTGEVNPCYWEDDEAEQEAFAKFKLGMKRLGAAMPLWLFVSESPASRLRVTHAAKTTGIARGRRTG